MKGIKRISALMMAGVLLVCVSFASLAEETGEFFAENTEITEITETTDAAEEFAAEETAAAGPAEEPAAVEETVPAEEPAAVAEATPAEEPAPVEETVTESSAAEEAVAEPVPAEETVTEPAAAEEPAAEEAADEEPADEPEFQAENEEDDTFEFDDDEDDGDEEYDAMFDDGDQGSVDPELVGIYFPNGAGPETDTADEDETYEEAGEIDVTEETEETESESPETEEADSEAETETVEERFWIESENSETIYIDEAATLIARSNTGLSGTVNWEVRDERWEEDVWETIGEGERLHLEVTEAIAGLLVRFTLSDGTVSEIFETNAVEKPAEGTAEDGGNGKTAEDGETAEDSETAEDAGSTDDGEIVGNDENTEDGETAEDAENTEDAENAEPEDADEETVTDETAAEEAEKTAVIITRAWITAETVPTEAAADADEGAVEDADDAEEAGTTAAVVILTANADPEMTGVNVWETRTGDSEENAWKRIGYGDRITVEMTEENSGSAFRFVMENGLVSEEYVLRTETDGTETAGEETETVIPELPEDRKVSFGITWDDEKPGFGSVAHFSAELEGYEGLQYTLQWQMSADDENWEDIEGATGDRMDVVLTEENYSNYWRVLVYVRGFSTNEETIG